MFCLIILSGNNLTQYLLFRKSLFWDFLNNPSWTIPFLIIANSATVIDLANIMQALGMEQALNLDGGGSSALYYQGEYKVGPGRQLPNAIIFKK